MAELQHTQTRPEFTWRFLGKYSASKDMRRIVVHIIATSEAEARSCLPLWDLVFAARLPANHLEVLRHA
ncbi:TPA: host cell division inhibitor Icd-like protein [Klebsiella pneumoniae]|nr:host cell division inhibitor Icd-like protein [Klebsiella pneumoniae]HBS5414900.1 host cell division inhibitor Icd-like protein [Klebsiella pneumoniae]HBV4428395.1 host cell division inhibitor Icd-like protein [Klebsiella pneumoniae]HBV6785625.1 host cell division inhibitor Icd-like protein [Klebsiella pneumoniae]HBV6815399.1 host cell division inhibitor Icd-like protein [Klebsiella pneumoniae]